MIKHLILRILVDKPLLQSFLQVIQADFKFSSSIGLIQHHLTLSRCKILVLPCGKWQG